MLNQYTYLRVKSDRQLTKIKFCFYLYYHSLEGWLGVLFSTSQRQSINTLITLQINYFLSSWKRWKNLFELREHSFSFSFFFLHIFLKWLKKMFWLFNMTKKIRNMRKIHALQVIIYKFTSRKFHISTNRVV